MAVNAYIASLVQYAIKTGLIEKCDRTYAVNTVLQIMQLDSYADTEPAEMPLENILKGLVDDAIARGICADDGTSHDLFDTRIMGALTPAPREVRGMFARLYAEDPEAATDWFYRFSQDTDYIRRYRIERDMRWMASTEYGNLDISINLSKPEKDPRAIAAAKAAPQSNYPKCQLCPENEGYAGRMNHPARQNHRVIPVTLCGEQWYFQYSPYVYYNEHCILFNEMHTPMKIERATFDKLLDFVTQFPHYFVGSNADLPIVGGSILTHEHFQGGRYTFAMEKAPVEHEISFAGFEDVRAGIVKWPMSVIRLTCADRRRIAGLAEKILNAWRSYTDESAFVYARTEGGMHSTITPIVRRQGDDYQMDLVLRNNITTQEHPLGVYHPHAELHHIKKENIGLIEVMGLAVLPARLKDELGRLADVIVDGGRITGDLEKHAPWVERLRKEKVFEEGNVDSILRIEVGKVFAGVLEHAGVFKRTKDGHAAFRRFIEYVNGEE